MKPQIPEASVTSLGVVAPPPIQVECDAFSGSLATLFEMVRRHKVDLLGVPLAPICMAYIHYLVELHPEELDQAAAATVALAYLVEQKSWAIIPNFEDKAEESPELEFVDPTIGEYGEVIEAFMRLEESRDQIYFRGSAAGDAYEIPFSLGQVTSGDLSRAFERLLRKAIPDPPEILNKPRRSLSQMMETVWDSLTDEFTSLVDLVPAPFTRSEAVWWFLSLLELIRHGRAELMLGDDDVLFARGYPA
ncbi:MAG: hypothetical protein JNJ45_05915 [Chthonomonas sp.]|nr:hypothetical protein [Chthonomonas sp.]